MKNKLATRSNGRHDRNADVHRLSTAKHRAVTPGVVLLVSVMALLVPSASREVLSAEPFRLPFRSAGAETVQPKPDATNTKKPPVDENWNLRSRFRLPLLRKFFPLHRSRSRATATKRPMTPPSVRPKRSVGVPRPLAARGYPTTWRRPADLRTTTSVDRRPRARFYQPPAISARFHPADNRQLPIIVPVGGTRQPTEPKKLPKTSVPKPTSEFHDRIAQGIESLRSADANTRRIAATELAWYGEKAKHSLPALYKLLDDEEPAVRIAAAAAVWEIDRQAGTIVPVLIELLQADDATVGTLSAYALGNIGPQAKRGLPDLHRVLDGSSGLFGLNVAEAIVRIDDRDRQAIDSLVGALKDPNADIRCQSAYALSAVSVNRSTDVVMALSTLRNDVDPRVRTAVDMTLRQLKAATSQQIASKAAARSAATGELVVIPQKFQKLIDQLANKQPNVRKDAAARLAWIGPEAKPALPALLTHLDDESAIVRTAVAWAVWEIDRQAEKAIPVLLSILNVRDENLVILAANILGSMRSSARPALPSLRRQLVGRRSILQMHLAEAIAKIEPADRPAIDLLTAALHDGNADIRSQAAFALSAVGVQQAGRVIPELASVLGDGNHQVRTASKLTLAGFLKSKQPGLRGLTAYQLGTVGPGAKPILPELRRLLASSDPLSRLYLAEAIVRIDPKDTQSVDLLLTSLTDANSDVRCQAAYALSSVDPAHTQRVVRRLSAALSDSDERVRSAAQLTLADFPPAIQQPPSTLSVVDRDRKPLQPVSPPRRLTKPAPLVVWSPHSSPINAPVPPVAPVVVINSNPQRKIDSKPTTNITSTQRRPAPVLQPRLIPIPLEREPGHFLPADAEPVVTVQQPVPLMPQQTETPQEQERSETYQKREEDIFELKGSLWAYAYSRPIPLDEESKRQPLPEEADAGFTDAIIRHPMGIDRGWAPTSYYWEAAALCHRPLYFEEINLERYGNSFGLTQPVVSAVHFFGTIPLLPYIMAAVPPHKCTYTLGHYRPGSDIPFRFHRLPVRLDASLVEAATIWGLVLIIH